MIFTQQWIREWLDIDLEPQSLIHQLTMAGLEVEAHGTAAADFSGVIVAEVQKTEPHPNADKLRVCQVFDGTSHSEVVCGAANVRPGLKVAFATVGAQLPFKSSEAGGASSFVIKKAKLRGVESHGMLCSAEELGLAEASDGLIELPSDAPVGADIRNYLKLDDQWFEMDLTPNRGDCLSIRGLTREIAVLNDKPFSDLEVKAIQPTITDTFPVRILAGEQCGRYLGRVVKGINTSAVTPLWMQEKLRRCGLRSIDPVVDVTNYVLLELGQPMHAFDLAMLNDEIVVRLASQGEKLRLLDGKIVDIQSDTLVIADSKGPLALAGIMGGEHSGVSSATRDIFLECAWFAPLAVAGRARRYGLHTDSSHRYERGVDPQLQEKAMARATELLLSIAGGSAGPVVDCRGTLPDSRQVELRMENIQRLLGLRIKSDDVVRILGGLGIQPIVSNPESTVFSVPSFRFDIAIEADLIEELARIYGYDRLPVTQPAVSMKLTPSPETTAAPERVRERLVTLGYQQVITYSFVEPNLLSLIMPEPAPVALQNPISADMSVMRTSLWAGLIQTLKHNVNRQQSRVRLFETGQVFLPAGEQIEQPEKLAGLIYGSRAPEDWSQARNSSDFFDIKGDLESVLDITGAADEFSFEKAEHPALHPGQSARILRRGEPVGWLGCLAPRIQRELDLVEKTYVFEIDLEAVLRAAVPSFTPLSKFPEVSRDLALVLDAQIPAFEVKATLRELAGEYLTSLRIFDVYQGDAIGFGKKSMALGLTWQHPSRTLGDDDINAIIERCVKGLEVKFNAKLRN